MNSSILQKYAVSDTGSHFFLGVNGKQRANQQRRRMPSICFCWIYYILRRKIIVCDEVSDIAIEFVITVCGTTLKPQ